MEKYAILCAVISGLCLVVIQIRKKIPLFGGLLSEKRKIELDKPDKVLALMALLFFVLCLGFLVSG